MMGLLLLRAKINSTLHFFLRWHSDRHIHIKSHWQISQGCETAPQKKSSIYHSERESVTFRLQELCTFLSNLPRLILRKTQNFLLIFYYLCSDMHGKAKTITSPMTSYTRTEILECISALSPPFATLLGFCNRNYRSQEIYEDYM